MPPSGFNEKCKLGILMFCQGLYEGCEEEVKSGKHESFEAAWKHEVKQIAKGIESLHITPEGKLVEK